MRKGILLILFILYGLNLESQTATEIVKRADEKRRGESAKAEMLISIIRPSWQRDMKVKTWARGEDHSIILITSPARDAGTAYLKREKEIWNWVPSIERSIKLPPSMMMQSWMGSDFTNDDLIKESSLIDDYYHEIVGDSLIQGKEVYKIKLTPKPESAVVWGKVYSWISKNDFLELQAEMYDEDGYLVNRVVSYDIKDLGGRMLPSVIEFIPVEKEGHKTVLSYESVEYNTEIPLSFFSLQKMKRLR